MAKPSLHDIIVATASYYGISPHMLYSGKRERKISHPRQVAYYLARKLTNMSYPAISSKIGGRDHTTVLYGERMVIDRLQKPLEHPGLDIAIKAISDHSKKLAQDRKETTRTQASEVVAISLMKKYVDSVYASAPPKSEPDVQKIVHETRDLLIP